MTKIAFMFPGQGAFEPGMGREIAEAVPAAMRVYEEGSAASGLDLKRLCFEGTVEELVETEVQQPALVTTCLAINAALRDRGIEPDYVVGHSVGEFSALGASNALSVTEAIALVRERGLQMAAAAKEAPGSMAAILGLADDVVENICRRIANVWPANYNCPGQLVVSGEDAAIEECIEVAQREGARRAVRLKVSGAFHSPLVALSCELLKPTIHRIDFKTPTANVMSTVTAKLEEAARYPSLLVEQLTAPVRFTQAARAMVDQGVTTFVEVGPGNVLSGLLKRIDGSVRSYSVNDLKSLDAAVSELG